MIDLPGGSLSVYTFLDTAIKYPSNAYSKSLDSYQTSSIAASMEVK